MRIEDENENNVDFAWVFCKISGPEQALVPPDGSYTQGYKEPSMSEQSTSVPTGCQEITGKKFRRHGCAGDANPTGAYVSWLKMKQRCLNPKNHKYPEYGGRGITVCERWMTFPEFLADMGDSQTGETIDRIDVNGNYEPGNCRWATRKMQQNNRRRNILMTFQGKTQTMAQWADELGIKLNTILYRLKRGWSHEKALSEPIGDWHRGNRQ